MTKYISTIILLGICTFPPSIADARDDRPCTYNFSEDWGRCEALYGMTMWQDYGITPAPLSCGNPQACRDALNTCEAEAWQDYNHCNRLNDKG